MTARLIFDSDTIADLPRDNMAATYSDLVPDAKTLAELRAEFPRGLVLIDRHGDPTGAATVLDVETGLHKPSDAPAWYDAKFSSHVSGLTVYSDRSNINAVSAAMGPRSFFRWIATLDGTMHIPRFKPGQTPAVIQFASAAMLGFHCDASVIWQDSWHRAGPVTWPNSAGVLSSLKAIASDAAQLAGIVQAHQ